MTDSFIAIVPARMKSTRLPDKPLADIHGIPMVIRTAQQAQKSRASNVIIATDDLRVKSVADEYNIDVCMTRADHPTGTDRLAEVVTQLGIAPDTLVVNVQGDEPCIDSQLIDAVAHALSGSTAAIATAAYPISEAAKFFNPNIVKVVCANDGTALYFSRAPIPWARDFMLGHPQQDALAPNLKALHHIGIYAYRTSFLKAYPSLQQGTLEQLESLEQLRALEHGYKIQVTLTTEAPMAGVDTPEDLERVRAFFVKTNK